MFYMISHNNILKFLETLWDVEKTCFSQHTGGTAGAIFNVLDCESRDHVLDMYGWDIYHFTEIVVSFKQTV